MIFNFITNLSICFKTQQNQAYLTFNLFLLIAYNLQVL